MHDSKHKSVRLRDYIHAWHDDHWFWPFLKQNKGLLAIIFLVGLITFVCAAALMFTSGYLISKSATHPYNILAVYVPVVLTRAFGIGRPTFKYLERINSHNWVLGVVSKLRVQLYQTLEKDAAFLQEHQKTGQIFGLLADDLDHLENFYLRSIFPTVVAYLVWLVVTIAVGIFTWTGTILVACVLALVLIVTPLFSLRVAASGYQLQKQHKAHEYTTVTEHYLGLADWVITHRKDAFITAGAKDAAVNQQSVADQERFQRWRNFGIQVLFGVLAIGLIIGSQHFLGTSKQLANYAAAVVLSLFPLIDCFLPVAQAMAEVPLYSDSLAHLNALTASVTQHQPTPVAQQPLTTPIETIRFDHVSFAYGPDQPQLLDDFSLTIHAGEKVAILGPSGEGKTTILQLLLGDLIPQAGTITVNDIPVAALQDERPTLFGYLNQAPFLFNTTIRDNIRLGAPAASDKQIMTVLDDVGLGSLVQQLPDGLGTPVTESGQRFSGGQQQRLALARILLKKTPILLLDEPTIGLDPVTEQALMQMVMQVSRNRTLIWVTHHLQGLETADQAIFLTNGKITMAGKPADLYRDNARFQQLYQLDVGAL
ncbi:thiol reductant ABC exporter subunit CydC [Schleiferilactobacillus perolens]|uniref:Cytochrome bd biosynthesis ABC-type transporter, ATPase and permease component n=1 Tax=Schleiferilactobacillus perolens DSM 12744 TaxID=1423792 RepID=A0A0R1N1P9_9LACO|nr:thiol reductant ABC exporter subunit CydC [Schleiferilactobacillus perolens]KRL14097.1 cytochrome bd biosynthesis ABC-type transporter, ATPase and permease component [Schleiferilactobacillus perolens DSM 12744]